MGDRLEADVAGAAVANPEDGTETVLFGFIRAGWERGGLSELAVAEAAKGSAVVVRLGDEAA